MKFSLTIAKNVGGNLQSEFVDISDKVFAQEYNESLVHQLVVAYMAGARTGSKSQKSRAEVSGGGSKPWRQKGTGRARVGSSRNPVWRSGGVTFAAKPRDFSQKVNKKMYRKGMSCILSGLVKHNRLLVVEDFQVENNKTRSALNELNKIGLKKALIVTDNLNENLYLSVRNLPEVGVCDFSGINPIDLIKFGNVVLTVSVVRKIEDIYG